MLFVLPDKKGFLDDAEDWLDTEQPQVEAE